MYYETMDRSPAGVVLKSVANIGHAFEAFKSVNDARLREIEKRGSADVLLTNQLDRINKRLDEFEGANFRNSFAGRRSRAVEETLASFEAAVGSKSLAISPGERKRRVNALVRAALVGTGAFNQRQELSRRQHEIVVDTAAEWKALNQTNDTEGGYLAPTAFVADILRAVAESSPVRSIVRIRTASARSIEQPKRTGVPTAQRVMEQGTRSETTGYAWGSTEIQAPECYCFCDISNANLEDSAFDLERELSQDSSDAFSQLESAEFAIGAGRYQLQGIITDAARESETGIQNVHSGSASTIADVNGQANGIINLAASVKDEYAQNATWILNRTTLGSVRKLKDDAHNYIWAPGATASAPNTILGRPYAVFRHMPAEGAGTYPMAYGDFSRGYCLYDRFGLFVLRDPFSQALSGNTRIWFRRRVGGAITLHEAIAVLKCAA